MADCDKSCFEISARDWSVSFQRRVADAGGQGRSPNRGALPYHEMERRRDHTLVIVPLHEGEMMWIGVTLNRGSVVKGETAYGDPIVATELGRSADGKRMMCFDSLQTHGGARTIDYGSVSVAHTRAEIGRAILMLALANDECKTYLNIAVVTPALFSDVSGRPAPERSFPAQSFGGWRLP
jgi:hypothetical protein